MKRIYRSQDNRILGGVCGGIGEYLNIDPLLIRIIWVAMIIVGGAGFFAYMVAWVIIPSGSQGSIKSTSNAGWYLGLALIIIGVALIFKSYWLPLTFAWSIFDMGPPALLIGLGLLIIYAMYREKNTPEKFQNDEYDSFKTEDNSTKSEKKSYRQLFRSRSDRKILGVCGGIAEYVNTDPVFVRAIFVILALFSFGFVVLLYFLLAMFIPSRSVKMV